jgi:hypothetical protein
MTPSAGRSEDHGSGARSAGWAAKERQSKAWFRRPEEQRAEDRQATLIRLGSIVRNSAPKGANDECPETCARAAAVVLDPTALRETIHAIRHLVSEHFYLREMRDTKIFAGLTSR